MFSNSLGKKMIAFSLTFAIGFSINFIFDFVSLKQEFESSKQKVQKIEQEVKIERNENQSNHISPKPLCKKYRDDLYIELIQKKIELSNLLRSRKTTSEEKKSYRQDLEKLDKELDKKSKQRKNQNKEAENLSSEPSRNLLYVEKCVEY